MTKTNSKPLEFSCHALKTIAVFVVGTFNDWKPDAAPLYSRLSNGERSDTLRLPLPRQKYKSVVDGQWCCEPGCDGANWDCPKRVPNAFGAMKPVIEATQT